MLDHPETPGRGPSVYVTNVPGWVAPDVWLELSKQDFSEATHMGDKDTAATSHMLRRAVESHEVSTETHGASMTPVKPHRASQYPMECSQPPGIPAGC